MSKKKKETETRNVKCVRFVFHFWKISVLPAFPEFLLPCVSWCLAFLLSVRIEKRTSCLVWCSYFCSSLCSSKSIFQSFFVYFSSLYFSFLKHPLSKPNLPSLCFNSCSLVCFHFCLFPWTHLSWNPSCYHLGMFMLFCFGCLFSAFCSNKIDTNSPKRTQEPPKKKKEKLQKNPRKGGKTNTCRQTEIAVIYLASGFRLSGLLVAAFGKAKVDHKQNTSFQKRSDNDNLPKNCAGSSSA